MRRTMMKYALTLPSLLERAEKCSGTPDDHPGLVTCNACAQSSRPLRNVEGFAPLCEVCAAEQGWTSATIQ
jgi:hypothetical protein